MLAPVALALVAAAALAVAIRHGLWAHGGPGPGLMPAIGAALMLLASLASMRSAAADDAEGGFPRSAMVMLLGMALIVPVTTILGLLGALACFTLFSLRVIDRVSLPRSVLLMLGVVGGSWLLFERLLSVPLPKPAFW